jgi:hypothetical protein
MHHPKSNTRQLTGAERHLDERLHPRQFRFKSCFDGGRKLRRGTRSSTNVASARWVAAQRSSTGQMIDLFGLARFAQVNALQVRL